MQPEKKERLHELLQSLKLREISPMKLDSERLGPLPQSDKEMNVRWKQTFANDDPAAPEECIRVFRPRYEFESAQDDQLFFKQESVFIIVLEIIDKKTFDAAWQDEEVRKVFMERQIQHTTWPIFRQQVQDGMSRLGIQPVTLPWLVD